MKNILVAIDFSASSKNAAGYAAGLAEYFGAKLTLFHAYHIPPFGYERGYVPPVIDIRSEREKEIKKWIQGLEDSYYGLDVNYHLEIGLAADIIEEVAKDRECDLIVVGLAGQDSPIKEHIFGSVATRVAETSKIPVLIIPEHVHYSKIKKIAYACDLDKNLAFNDTLTKVKYFCALFDAELEILNVKKPQEEMSVEKSETEIYVEERFHNTKHNSFFIYDDKVDKGLIEFLGHHESDILITCPKMHNFLHKLFIESNTKKLAFHSPIPILTIHCQTI
jgi:nucleotide-binding universal stress UspA family protein